MKNLLNNPVDRASYEYARQVAAHYAKSFYFSARFLPKPKRLAVFALYGYCRYVDNLIDKPRNRNSDELVRELDYLTEEIHIAYRTGESEHPVISPFIHVAKRTGIPEIYPLDLLRGVKMDVEINRYQTFDDLYLFCYRVAGVVGLMMTHILGYRDDNAFIYAEKLGIAMQLTNILRDIHEDEKMGRIYLPQDELLQFGLCDQDVSQKRISESFVEMMKFQVSRARSYYDQAQVGIPMLQTDSRFAIYAASRIYRGILDKIAQQNYNPFLGRAFVPQSKKMAILFQELTRTRLQLMTEKLNGNHLGKPRD
ncbi:phytoene/squalene synthase family protein [candidate division KSB1 bacterium]|nr:phytoene/squalene synthase family protein [candidate division KSB1 bacterium]